jgi:hypothetical protein
MPKQRILVTEVDKEEEGPEPYIKEKPRTWIVYLYCFMYLIFQILLYYFNS